MFDNFIIVWESLIFIFFVSNYHKKKNYYALTVFLTLNVAAQLYFKNIGKQGTPLIVTIIILQYIWQCLLLERRSNIFVFVACLSITIVMSFNAVVLFIFRRSLSVSMTDNIRVVIVIAKVLPTILLLFKEKVITFDEEFNGIWYSIALMLSVVGISSNIIQIIVSDFDITPIYNLILYVILAIVFVLLFIRKYLQTENERVELKVEKKNSDIIKLQQYRYNTELHNTHRTYRKGEIKALGENAFETAKFLKEQYERLIIPKVVETGFSNLDYHLNNTALKFKEKNIKLDYHINLQDNSEISRTWNIDKFNRLVDFVHSNSDGVKKAKIYMKDFRGACSVTFDLGDVDIDSALPEGLELNIIDGKTLLTSIINY